MIQLCRFQKLVSLNPTNGDKNKTGRLSTAISRGRPCHVYRKPPPTTGSVSPYSDAQIMRRLKEGKNTRRGNNKKVHKKGAIREASSLLIGPAPPTIVLLDSLHIVHLDFLRWPPVRSYVSSSPGESWISFPLAALNREATSLTHTYTHFTNCQHSLEPDSCHLGVFVFAVLHLHLGT